MEKMYTEHMQTLIHTVIHWLDVRRPAATLGSVLGLQQCLGGWCVSSGIHVNAKTRGFLAEELHCNKMMSVNHFI